jgi:hypothetical protein
MHSSRLPPTLDTVVLARVDGTSRRFIRLTASTVCDRPHILPFVDKREELEAEFIAEILRIVGPGADPEDYAVAPNTSNELLETRVQRLRELPSDIGHDELMRRVGPRNDD